MSRIQWILLSVILFVGVLAAALLVRVESLTPVEQSEEAETVQEAADGPHQGVILGKDQPTQLEVVAEHKGRSKLQLRFYALKGKEVLAPQPGQLQVSWKRLGQTHRLAFRFENQAWVGEPLLDEPHSFELTAQWQQGGQKSTFVWQKFENRLEMTAGQLRESQIGFGQVGSRTLSDTLEFPGKIAANQERYVHITPRISGTVTQVYRHLGESVRKGDVLAVLESRELSDLRLDYLSTAVRYQQARERFRLEQSFFQNTATLLRGLRRGEEIGSLHLKLMGMAIGADRQVLIGAYAEYQLAWKNFLREQQLLAAKATSQAEFQVAEEALQHARASYEGAVEEVSRQRQISLTEREQEVQRLAPERDMAQKKLQLLGLPAEGQSTRFELRAPMNGQLLSQHIAAGEFLDAHADAFVLADLSEVWAEMMVPESHLESVRMQQHVEVISQTGKYSSSGVVSHLGAVVEEASRTAEAHAVVLNPGRFWKPGMFVTIQLQSNPYTVPLAVKTSAIQTLEGIPVVFVRDGEALQAVPVALGRRSQEWTEIRSGLSPGQSYVASNSFLLKAELEKALAAEE